MTVNTTDKLQFLVRDVIYASCAYLMMPVSVCLSVCLSVAFVHCSHRVRWIPDIFACLDRWMSLLRKPGWPVYTGRIYGWCVPGARIYGPYIRPVHTAHTEKACHAMFFSSKAHIYG